MPDKNAAQKRRFYIDKILECKLLCDNKEFNELSIFGLKELLVSVKALHDKFENKCLSVQCDSEQALSENQLKPIIDENKKIDALCLQLKAKISMRIENLTTQKYALPTNSQITSTQSVSQNAFQQVEKAIEKKSDEISVFFDGEAEEFDKFITSFESKTKFSSNEEKGDLLKKACKSEALNLIQNLDFQSAMKKLNSVYSDAYENTHKALNKLFSVKSMQGSTSKEMHTLLNNVLECESEFMKSSSEGKVDMILMFSTVEKFDKATKRVWERFRISLAESWSTQGVSSQSDESISSVQRLANQHIPSFDDVKRFMQSEIKILRIDEKQCVQTQQQASNIHTTNEAEKPKYADVAKSAYTGAIPKQKQQQSEESDWSSTLAEEKANCPAFLQCKLCVGIHPIYKCKVYKSKSLAQRQKYVNDENLCVRCLKPKHTGKCLDAKSNNPCPVCANESYHNSTLCETKAAKAKAAKDNKQPSVSDDDWN